MKIDLDSLHPMHTKQLLVTGIFKTIYKMDRIYNVIT